MRTPLRLIAYLRKNGLSISEIENLDDTELLAWGVAFGEIDGGVFLWDQMRWMDRSP